MKQNRVTRAQILELLIGPNGDNLSAFASEEDARALWADLRNHYTLEFLNRWYYARRAKDQRPFAEIAHQYARDVVEGRVLACKWVRLACRRHLEDLEKAAQLSDRGITVQNQKGAYRFDTSKAERACRFIELLPHVKGGWAAKQQLISLEPWQIFIVCSIFGWVHASTGFRRFTQAYILVSRKNAKSTLAAGIALYMFACDGEFGSEVYSGATSEDQALEVFRPARQMMERTPELSKVLGLRTPPAVKQLSMPENGSRMEPVIGKPGDGASPHCGIVDEYHEHRSDALVDTIRTGMGARQQPLLFIITTAGDNPAGPCKLMQDDVCKILDGLIQREEVFGIVYTIDDPTKWASEESLVMANPNIGVSVFRDFLLMEQRAALANPRKQGTFKIKHSGVWVGAAANYFDLESWGKLADPSLSIDECIGYPCVVSLDLATKRDFTAMVTLFRKTIKGKDHFFVFSKFYLPQAEMEKAENAHYREWRDYIDVEPGPIADHERISGDAIQQVKLCHAQEFTYDPWNADMFAQVVAKETHATIVDIPQNVGRLSAPMKELDALIAEGRIHHDGNPVATWMLGNVMAREDANENVFPRKGDGRTENKIDFAPALIMALSRLMVMKSNTIKYTGLRSVAC